MKPIEHFIKPYLGTTYGIGPGKLICWDLVCRLYKDGLNIVLQPMEEETQLIKIRWTSIQLGLERPWDVLLFRMPSNDRHVGIVIGNNRMVHIQENVDLAIERYRNLTWNHLLKSIYRIIP